MSTVLPNPGNIVVPLSTILDHLKGKLNSNEIDALLAAVLAKRKNEVRPGDLITVDLINQILSELADLQIRLALLEGTTGGPVLISRSPLGDTRVGSLLTLIGNGFDPTLSNNTVLLDSIPINSFIEGSDSTRLLFQIPDLFASLPRLVDVSVKTGTRVSNSLQIRILNKQETQAGNVVILPQTSALGQINVGQTYTLKWLVDGQTALPASYNLRLVFSDLAGAAEAAWITTLDPSSERQIVRGNPLAVTATVKVPDGATRAQIALEVKSTDGLFIRTSDAILFKTGSTPPISDDRALLTKLAIGPFDSNGNPNTLRSAKITVDGSQLDGLQLKFNTSGEVLIKLFVTTKSGSQGDYAYSAEFENPSAVWRIESVLPLAHLGLTALDERTITVKLKNADSTLSTSVNYLVIRAQHTPAGSSTANFVSFIRIPIQGFIA